MEQIETQVSDLRYLTSTPGERRVAGLPPLPVVASPASVVSGENHQSPAHAHAGSADGGAKRKADEDGGEKGAKAQRSKRNRVSLMPRSHVAGTSPVGCVRGSVTDDICASPV